jgi:energy-coupling factor transport system substrate-specific component
MALSRYLSAWEKDERVRFLVAGGLAALVNWLVRFPLDLVMPFAAAVVLAMVIGMVCGFLLYRAWVFPGSVRPLIVQVRDFVLVNLVGQAVMVLVAIVLRWILLAATLREVVAAAVAHATGIAIGAAANFLGHRHITFRNRAS